MNHYTLTGPVEINTNIKQQMYLQRNLKILDFFFSLLAPRLISPTVARIATF